MGKKPFFTAIVFLALVSQIDSATAEQPVKYRADYTVSAFGLPVGKSTFNTTVADDGTYKINGKLRSSGVARLFAAINGRLQTSGTFSGQNVKPNAFAATYIEGKAKKGTQFDFAGSTITGATNKPPVKKRGKWIPLDTADLANALDPISAIMVPAQTPRAVCNRTIKAFDGAMRLDVKLSYLRTNPFSTKGFKGDVVTCRGRYIPVSGYDAKKQDINWMRDKGSIEVSFAPIGSSGFYAPVNAKVKTRLVTLRVRASRFEQLTN
ncbi:MAG: DUF3108 domain-containing protein [Pseudomonadota bacterium]